MLDFIFYIWYTYIVNERQGKKLFQKSFKKCLTFKKWFDIIKLSKKGKWLKMTPAKRKEARAKQEALQKARKDQRLGLAKQSQKKSKKR